MRHVEIELRNIQSHEQTKFVLKPGLNFILADDNNVGKSTIFKILLLATKMPSVSNEDLSEIVRAGASKAYASFKFDDKTIVLWFFRESDRIKTFFEVRSEDGGSIRVMDCPKELLDALDIVKGSDGQPINFNDADSVQLIVQDSPKNDEIIARVLIDDHVEEIREKMHRLGKEIVEDYKAASLKLDNSNRILESMQYVDTVDTFKDEKALLEIAATVADSLVENCKFTTADVLYGENDLRHMQSVLDLLNAVKELDLRDSIAIDEIEFSRMHAVADITSSIADVNFEILRGLSVSERTLVNLRNACLVAQSLRNASISCSYMQKSEAEMQLCLTERNTMYSDMSQRFKTVDCPVKGQVFYSKDGCVPAATMEVAR